MEYVNGAAPQGSHRAIFDVLRPIVRVLRASGFAESAIRSAADQACRLYSETPVRGVWLDQGRIAELVDVVMVWSRDPDFIDEAGLPRRLSVGGGAASFPALLRRARCSVPSGRALAELQALGSVQSCDQGRRVRLLSNVLIPVTGKGFVVPPMIGSIRRFAETIEHNLCENPRPGEGRMHRWASCAELDPRQLGEVQRFVRANGQTFLEAMDEKLSACAMVGGKRSAKQRGITYGVGLYVFVEEPRGHRRPATKRHGRR